MYNTRFYWIYRRIIDRCNNPNVKSYYRYGGKGIKCLWKNFEKFRNDMYESYLQHIKDFGERNTTIDRINNSKHYCKKNCRWATYKQQGGNTSRVKNITFNGKTLNISEWAKELGVSQFCIIRRLRVGWSLERTLTEKTSPGKNQFFKP